MQKEKVVLILSGFDEQGAINAICRQKEAAFQQAGKQTCFIDVSGPDFVQNLQNALLNFEIEFAFSYLGIGADLSWKLADTEEVVNLWDYHNIPFLKLQGDLPSYFISRHGAVPNTSINIYGSSEVAQIQSWYYQAQKTPYIINTAMVYDQQPIENVSFKNRANGTLVFLKNGNDPAQLIEMWQKNLPQSMTQDLLELSQGLLPPILRCEPVNIFEAILDFVTTKMGDALACKELVRLYSAQLDDYFRRVKSTLVANTLKQFPVKIIGRNWEHVNTGQSIAKFSNDMNFAQHSKEIFDNELGIIDMTPNLDLTAHDRFNRAVGNYAFILTNKTSWMQKNFPEFNDLTYIFDATELENKVDFLLKNKDYVIEQGKLLGTIGNERMDNMDFVNPLIQASEKLKFIRSAEKPTMQDFYIW